MTLETGGIGDKLGNRYEFRHVGKQLLRLAQEEIEVIIHEPIGSLEAGVDLIVYNKDESIELQQCKSSNSGKNWTIAELNSAGILSRAFEHLSKGNMYIYKLITPMSSPEIDTLTMRARSSSDCVQTFYEDQIKARHGKVNATIQTRFDNLCRYLSLSPDIEDDIDKVRDFLLRFEVAQVHDNEQARSDLLGRLSDIFYGNTEQMLDELAGYTINQNKLRIKISTSDVNNFLHSRNFKRRDLSYNDKIHPRISTLNDDFNAAFSPLSTGLIIRSEVNEICTTITEGNSIVIHGKSGVGKSGLIHGLIQMLCKREIPYLAIKLDKRIPSSSASSFGMNELSLPDSPVRCLSVMAGGEKCVLIINALVTLFTGKFSLTVFYQSINILLDSGTFFSRTCRPVSGL